MKAYMDEESRIIVTFSSEEERNTVFDLIESHIRMMPMAYRKRSRNWVIVSDLLHHGCGFSTKICRELGVDPDAHKWERKEEQK